MDNEIIELMQKLLKPLHDEIKDVKSEVGEVKGEIKRLSEKLDSYQMENARAVEMVV